MAFTDSLTPEIVAAIAGLFFILLIIGIAIYIYTSWAYMSLARRTKTEPAWLAWIPIANYYLISKTAKMHWWPMLLLIGNFIPFIGFITGIVFFVFVVVWNWKIMERVGRPGWWALTIFIFPIFLVLLGIAAWGNPGKKR